MKTRLLFLLFILPLLLLSCEKAPHIKTPDKVLDGRAQKVVMEATPIFDVYLIYDWSYDEYGNLFENSFPLNETPWVSDFVGEWFELHTDQNNRKIAELTVSENNTGLTRKITIEVMFKGKSDSIRITQNPL